MPELSSFETWLANQPGSSPDPPEGADELLLDRLRLGLRLILVGVAIVFVGERVLRGGERPLVNLVQAINFVAVAAALAVLGEPSRRLFNVAVAFVAYAVTILATGAVGVVAGDAMTPVVMFVGLAVFTATFVPWSPWWQLLSVVLLTATAVWTVAAVVPTPRLYWLQDVGSIAPTLASTVVISHLLRRQRAAVDSAERERRSREESLREANRRLEQEIEEHKSTANALRFAMRELDHRVKNTLATVQSVADQTLRASTSIGEFRAAFYGRLQALARIHVALAGRGRDGLSVAELIELVVGPYRRNPESVSIESGDTFLSSELVRVLGMALHELATNAAKYGALSTNAGHVAISSRLESNGGPRLRISWSERDGPPVGTPTHRGFGMKLIEDALAYEVEGRVTVQFPGQGLRCEIEIPVPPG
jgi:two-component sensor histidine kinase